MFSQAEHCPGKYWVKLSIVKESVESSWALSRKGFSQAEHCPGQCWVKLSIVQDSVESKWALSRKLRKVLSQAEHCPGQCWVKLSIVQAVRCPGKSDSNLCAVRDIVESSYEGEWSCALSGTMLNKAVSCLGKSWPSNALNGTMLSQAVSCLGKNLVKLRCPLQC